MRNVATEQASLFSYSQTADFVPANHPLQRIRTLGDSALESMNGMFNRQFPAACRGFPSDGVSKGEGPLFAVSYRVVEIYLIRVNSNASA